MANLDDKLVKITGNILLFCLIFGMSATVDTACFKAQLKNRKAILTGIILQFLLMPLLGFLLVISLDLDHVTGLTLLVLTASPGGSYSNWWCSLFNADLALSVTMTAISTFVSIVMLPLNLYVYARFTYGDEIIQQLQWQPLMISVVTVIVGIVMGWSASYYFDSREFHLNANRLGNFAGISLIVFSLIMSNSNSEYQLWDRDWSFYFGVAAPCLIGLVIANGVTTALWLVAPERVTVAIECVYQNTGIATTVAVAMFNDDELAQAIGVPAYYGLVEATILFFYCTAAWKNGWTKAPPDVSMWKMLTTSYEVKVRDVPEGSDTADNYVLSTFAETPKVEEQEKFSNEDQQTWDYVDYGDAVPPATNKEDPDGNAKIYGV